MLVLLSTNNSGTDLLIEKINLKVRPLNLLSVLGHNELDVFIATKMTSISPLNYFSCIKQEKNML